jgi:hypothetical protein
MSDGTGLAEALLGLDGFGVLGKAVTVYGDPAELNDEEVRRTAEMFCRLADRTDAEYIGVRLVGVTDVSSASAFPSPACTHPGFDPSSRGGSRRRPHL